MIKRCIGLPGDTLLIRDAVIYAEGTNKQARYCMENISETPSFQMVG
jgi:signal peptidase I